MKMIVLLCPISILSQISEPARDVSNIDIANSVSFNFPEIFFEISWIENKAYTRDIWKSEKTMFRNRHSEQPWD